jgi:hypothetical protein
MSPIFTLLLFDAIARDKPTPDRQHNCTDDRSDESCGLSLRIQPERLTVIRGSQRTSDAEHECKEEAALPCPRGVSTLAMRPMSIIQIRLALCVKANGKLILLSEKRIPKNVFQNFNSV